MAARFVVRIDRATDGSRTYKGAWNEAHCDREAAAWREDFPDYGVDVLPYEGGVAADFRKWLRITRPNGPDRAVRYYPEPEPVDA